MGDYVDQKTRPITNAGECYNTPFAGVITGVYNILFSSIP
jgi:hypothetical protein